MFIESLNCTLHMQEEERPDLSALINAAVGDAKGWFHAQKAYLILSASEAAGRLAGTIVVWVIVALLAAGVVMMLTVSFALWLGQLLDSYALGFLSAGGLLLLITLLFYFLLMKKISDGITLTIVNSAQDDEAEV
jgi:hypothetical protein